MKELTQESLQIVSRIMHRRGARCTPEQFQAAVNITFHNFGSEYYDNEHSDMWGSLPQQFSLIADDCLRQYSDVPKELRVLDIGAGTGLASHCLVATRIGAGIKMIDLLDTSPAMLKKAEHRSLEWTIPVRSHLGLIDRLPAENLYDVIVSCSVLHHVPDLQQFCKHVRQHQAPGGIFLHLQDPNGRVRDNLELARRSANLGERQEESKFARFTPKRIWGRIVRELTGTQGDNYVLKTNHSLLEQGLITSPLKVAELYAITDIHVNDGRGISIEHLKDWLPDYECISHRTYGFFGKLWSELPSELRKIEEELSLRNDLNGAYVAAAWRLKSLELT